MDSNDFNPKTSRRRIVQAMAILAGSSLSGCNSWSENEPEEPVRTPDSKTDSGTSRGSGGGSSTESADLSPPNVGGLINNHNVYLSGYSFTLGAELRAPKWTNGDLKQFTYRTTETGDASQVVESLDRDDQVNQLEQYFTSQNHHVLIDFVDSRTNSADLTISQQPPSITGVSILDTYLIGAALESGEVIENPDDGLPLIEYPISSHREQDFESGQLVTAADEYVAQFRMEWVASGEPAHIEITTQNIDETTVEVPNR